MIAGLLDPTSGEIRVDGEDIRRDLLAHRRRIGYVPETPDVYSYLTGPEYLTLAEDASSISHPAARSRSMVVS